MKSIFLFLALSLCCFAVSAQVTATKDASGNYVQTAAKPKTAAELTANATNTGKTFTDKDGKTFPVWVTATGKTFYVATGKTSGKPYRRYFKIQE